MLTTGVRAFILLLTLRVLARVWLLREQAMRRLIELESEAAGLREKARLLEGSLQTKGELGETFKGPAASGVENSVAQFLNQAKSSFEQSNELSKLDSEQRHKAMDSLIKPVSEAL